MIQSVTATNFVGEEIKMVLKDPWSTGFNIVNITGIGPESADINTTNMATNHGSIFNSARLVERNIVFQIKFMFSPTIEEVRHKSYKYFPLMKPIKLTFETDTRTVVIDGYVETNKPTIFTKEELTQISIICPDPNFYSSEDSILDFYGIEPKFEFPFSNESLTENLIEFGEILTFTQAPIFYDGDVDVGMVMTIYASGPASGIVIHSLLTRESMTLDTTRIPDSLQAGDEITINTNPNFKSITLLRQGVRSNILNALDRNSDWLMLHQGDNVIAYTAEEGLSNLQFKVVHRVAYEGV